MDKKKTGKEGDEAGKKKFDPGKEKPAPETKGRLNEPFGGYDEEKTGNNPGHQGDFDIDENNSDQRSDEYKQFNEGQRGEH